MIVEERCYVLRADYTPKHYFEVYEPEALELQKRILGHLEGFYVTEVGDLNVLVHLWRYESFEDRQVRRAKLAAEPKWQAYLAQVRPMLQSMSNRLLTPAPFSPAR